MAYNDSILETVRIWIDDFKSNGLNVDDEINEAVSNIDNMKLWGDYFGIDCCKAYIEWLKAYKNGDVDE